jgi:hypothetical protein
MRTAATAELKKGLNVSANHVFPSIETMVLAYVLVYKNSQQS